MAGWWGWWGWERWVLIRVCFTGNEMHSFSERRQRKCTLHNVSSGRAGRLMPSTACMQVSITVSHMFHMESIRLPHWWTLSCNTVWQNIAKIFCKYYIGMNGTRSRTAWRLNGWTWPVFSCVYTCLTQRNWCCCKCATSSPRFTKALRHCTCAARVANQPVNQPTNPLCAIAQQDIYCTTATHNWPATIRYHNRERQGGSGRWTQGYGAHPLLGTGHLCWLFLTFVILCLHL